MQFKWVATTYGFIKKIKKIKKKKTLKNIAQASFDKSFADFSKVYP